MPQQLTGPYNSGQQSIIQYLNGVTARGVVTNDSSANFFSELAGAWANGVINYYFDPGSHWTTAERNAFLQAMAVWSGVTNVTFRETADPNAAALLTIANISRHQVSADENTGETTPITDDSEGEENGISFTINGHTVSTTSGTSARNTVTGGTVGTTTIGTVPRSIMLVNAANPDFEAHSETDTSPLGNDTFNADGNDGFYAVVHELGHVLGLGHAGPYNGSANDATQQRNQYDTHQWSLMSYINPSSATAAFRSQYPAGVTATNWNYTSEDGRTRSAHAQTPMMLDFPAVQQFYGTPTSNLFDGGETFGFNSNIRYTDTQGQQASLPVFDFSINQTPVVTLWDSGTDNTLDLSGFNTASQIDLRPGSFSSAAGYVNNIGIAEGTRIDRAIGGAGDDVFLGNSRGNVFDGGGGTNEVRFSATRNQYTVRTGSVSGTYVVSGPDGTDLLRNIQRLTFSDASGLSPAQLAGGGTFDAMEYLASNADVARAYGTDTNSALEHYALHGAEEGRNTNSFDALRYLASNPDLVRAFGSNTNAAQQHYVLFGRNENRNLTSFDPSRYLSSYGDLRAAFGTDTNAALLHYLTFGANEGRTLGFTTGAAPAGNADPLRRQDGILGAAS